jgi:integrase/recombinase XerD
MLHLEENRARNKVNVVKKVKVDGKWKLCPAIVEPGGKLKDRVQVNGRAEVHNEGVYYIEWREDGQRLRQSVANRHHVLERARLKSLELDARKAGIHADGKPVPLQPSTKVMIGSSGTDLPSLKINQISNAAGVILSGVESYLQGIINASVRLQLEALGIAPKQIASESASLVGDASDYPTTEDARLQPTTSGSVPPRETGQTMISQVIEAYLKDVEPPQREQKTYDEYRLVLHKFRDTCGKRYLQEINRDDCLGFMRHLYSIGNEARTVFNRMGIVQQLLKLSGITGLLKPRDKPRFVANVREMYQPEELEALFKACGSNERVLYMFFLLTGERDKEVRYTTWSDIDFRRKCVRVTAKKHLGFKPKDKEEREIPVPSLLLTALKEYKGRQAGPNPNDLIFPTSQGRPDKKFENKLKRIVRRGKLNCGHCESKHGNKCSEGPHCSKWYLHKFRHTFATANLEHGVSIRTLQEWLGHSDLESTMVYLKFVRHKDIQKLLDTSQMAGLAAESLGLNNGPDHEGDGASVQPA